MAGRGPRRSVDACELNVRRGAFEASPDGVREHGGLDPDTAHPNGRDELGPCLGEIARTIDNAAVFPITGLQIILNIIAAVVCGFAISFVYRNTYRGPGYSIAFANSIISTIRGCSIGSPPPVQRNQAPNSPASLAIRFQSSCGNRSPERSW